MMQYTTTEGAQGICPSGWHIPSDDEWKILEGTVDSQYGVGDPEWDDTGWRGSDAGDNLKEIGAIHWPPSNTGTNLSGYTALPGGLRLSNGTFDVLGIYGHFWSSSEDDDSDSKDRILYSEINDIYRHGHEKTNGFSVRCLEND